MFRYSTELPVYNVWDADSGELLSTHVTMKELMRRHGAIIEHLKFRRVAGFPEY